MNTAKIVAPLFLAALLAGTAGCAPGGGGSPAPTSAPAGTASVSMPMASATPTSNQGTPGSAATAITVKDFAFGAPVTVSPGATVTVTNQDTAAHTVTADQGQAFDAKVKGSGGTATFTAPSRAGTYTFHCSFHPEMHGTLTVK